MSTIRIGDIPSLPELVREAASEFSNASALESARDPGVGLTYAGLLEQVHRGSSILRKLDLAKGDRVLLALEARPEWAVAFFAILEAGLVAVPLPQETEPRAAATIAANAQARAAVLSDRTAVMAPHLGSIARIPLEELLGGEVGPGRLVGSGRQDLAVLAFTSGSTDRPRAVELTHANLLSNLDSLLQARRAAPGDALLSMLPPAHLFELMGGLLGPLACGARVVYAASLLPNRLVKALRVHRITHALAVPALVDCLYEEVLSQLVEMGVVEPERTHQGLAETAARLESETDEENLRQIRSGVRAQIGAPFGTLIVGGAAIDPFMARILSALGIRMEVGYGLTEASPIVSVGFSDQCPSGSVGRPLPGVAVRIAANGEILLRGPSVMRGYWQAPQATAAALAGGWLRTGDSGRLDDDGHLFITGRLKEAMVTSAGETIYPEEAESYYESPLFAELCVTALSAKDGNDLPTLFVVAASPGIPDHDLEEAFADLRASAPARLRLARMVRLPDPLPRTATGKVRRRALAQSFAVQGSRT